MFFKLLAKLIRQKRTSEDDSKKVLQYMVWCDEVPGWLFFCVFIEELFYTMKFSYYLLKYK